MKLSLPGVCLIIITTVFAATCVAQTPSVAQTPDNRTLEDRLNLQDSVILNLNGSLSAMQNRMDSITQVNQQAENQKSTMLSFLRKPFFEEKFSALDVLLAVFAGFAGLVALLVSIFVPLSFLRENRRLRKEMRTLFSEIQTLKLYAQSRENRNIAVPGQELQQEKNPVGDEPPVETATEQKPGVSPLKKDISTAEFLARLELCIIANREDEFNRVVAEVVQYTASKDTTALLRYLHRIAACVFRGRMPAQAPVMAEVKQYLWACESPVFYQTDKIVSWARSSTRLSDAQRAYIFSISTELEKMLAEHNREYND